MTNHLSLDPLEQILLAQLQRAEATDNLVVAYSGGIDSKVLLTAAANLRDKQLIGALSAIHVSHGLQQAAVDWPAICGKDCQALKVKLITLSVSPEDIPESNIEAEARRARYQLFAEQLKPEQCLLLAHHQEDQAETLLFRLLRGAGILGASAMPSQRSLGNARLLRPLLTVSQAKIAAYAKARSLTWIDDPSNQDPNYSRNYLRHRVLPQLVRHWPDYANAFARFSRIAAQQHTLLTEVAVEDLRRCQAIEDSRAIQLTRLQQLSMARQKNLLHYWGSQHAKSPPTEAQINELQSQLIQGGSHQLVLGFGGKQIKLFQGVISLQDSESPQSKFHTIESWDMSQSLQLSNGVVLFSEPQASGLRAPLAGETVSIRQRQGGEVCQPYNRAHSRQLKKVYQELKVPTWQRSWLPLVYYGEALAAVPGVFVSKGFHTQDPAKAPRAITVKPS